MADSTPLISWAWLANLNRAGYYWCCTTGSGLNHLSRCASLQRLSPIRSVRRSGRAQSPMEQTENLKSPLAPRFTPPPRFSRAPSTKHTPQRSLYSCSNTTSSLCVESPPHTSSQIRHSYLNPWVSASARSNDAEMSSRAATRSRRRAARGPARRMPR